MKNNIKSFFLFLIVSCDSDVFVSVSLFHGLFLHTKNGDDESSPISFSIFSFNF